MNHQEKALKEIEALESVIINPTEEVADDLKEIQLTQDVTPVADLVDEVVPEVKEKKKYTNWKKRFQGLKSSHDATVFDLRQQVIRRSDDITKLTTTIDSLKATVSKLMDESGKDIFDGVITAEDTEILGNEAVDSMKKVTQAAIDAAVNPLKEELEDNRLALAAQAKADDLALRAQSQTDFLRGLGNLVEDYAEIDVDPAFKVFMRELDPASGHTRERLFKVAEHSGDVGRVAGFFNDFKKASAAINPTLEEQITPTNNAVGSTAENTTKTDKPISMAYMKEFYSQVNKGRYRGKERLRQELSDKIDAAIAIGNITQ
ncbi:hypothetical protein DRQ25_11885 [Candidatus Fermentibacteria bacterium]|nr:MAG: hypothetical protein DRQ25_11885 [Candidatus Fermentibacteria bacterium]